MSSIISLLYRTGKRYIILFYFVTGIVLDIGLQIAIAGSESDILKGPILQNCIGKYQ